MLRGGTGKEAWNNGGRRGAKPVAGGRGAAPRRTVGRGRGRLPTRDRCGSGKPRDAAGRAGSARRGGGELAAGPGSGSASRHLQHPRKPAEGSGRIGAS